MTKRQRAIHVWMLLLAALTVACADGSTDDLGASNEPKAPELEGSELALVSQTDWKWVGLGASSEASVALDRWLPNVAYASSGGGLYVSWTFGEHWTRLEQLGGYSVLANPNRPGGAFAFSGSTLVETRNAGLSWQPVSTTLPGRLLAVAPGNTSVMWAEGSRYLYRSVDHGSTWTGLDFGGPGGCCVKMVALSEDDIYVSAVASQLQRSLDGGESWARSTFATLYLVGAYDVDQRSPEVVYAGNYLPYGPTGLRKSSDGLETWSTPSAALANALVTDIATSPVDGRLYVVTSDNGSTTTSTHLQISTDEGVNFTETSSDAFAGAEVYRVVPHPRLRCVAFARTSRGLYRTANGGGTCR
ncbi:MAG: glycosyl hydrolase, repeat-containing protein [Myxococcaceae bacterium]|nr:glycosyl hydrolase, repeat-containing protein [Myxococcaceae bacterium]